LIFLYHLTTYESYRNYTLHFMHYMIGSISKNLIRLFNNTYYNMYT